MGRDRVFPRFLGDVNSKYHTPYNATIVFGLLNLVFLWGATLIGSLGNALDDIASTLGLMAAIFYLLTASAAVWYYRRVIRSSTANLILGGFLPGLGAAFMLFVIIYSLASDSLNGIEIGFGFGFGFAIVGLIISFIVARTGHAPYYTDPRSSLGDHIEEELAEPEAS
jgi:amino acid transporter